MTISLTAADTAVDGRERILHERAVLLSKSLTSQADQATVEVLVCGVRNERYAIDLSILRSVQRPTGLARVPCAPHQVAGVLNVRGELVAVLDLASTLGLGSMSISSESLAVLVELSQGIVGILVDSVVSVRSLALAQLDAALTDRSNTRGIADGSLVLLDLEQLLSEQALGGSEDDGWRPV